MTSDPASAPGKNREDKAAKRAEKKQGRQAMNEPDVDIAAFERRVHLAELRVREVEAEIRYFELSQKRRSMKSERRGKAKEMQGKQNKNPSRTDVR